jgi:hypothetical protein
VAQGEEHLPGKNEGLSLNPSAIKRKRKEKKINKLRKEFEESFRRSFVPSEQSHLHFRDEEIMVRIITATGF